MCCNISQRGWGTQLETEPCFDKENQPNLLQGKRPWLRQMSHPQQAVKHWIYFICSVPLAAGICLSSASWNSILLHSASLWPSPPIWYLCCVVTPAEKILGFVQIMEKHAHLDHLKLITFLMGSSYLAEILQLHFSGMWLHCKRPNTIHHKLRCETSSNPPEQKNELLLQITHINTRVVKPVFGKLPKNGQCQCTFFLPWKMQMIQQRDSWNHYK